MPLKAGNAGNYKSPCISCSVCVI